MGRVKLVVMVFCDFLRDEQGAELTEWIVFASLLVVGIAGSVLALREDINDVYDRIRNCVRTSNVC